MNWLTSNLVFPMLLFNVASHAQVLVEEFGPKMRHQTLSPLERLSISETPDGGILLAGHFDFLNGSESGALIKLDIEGKVFPGFQKMVSDGEITKAMVLPGGKILVYGSITQINGTPCHALSRLNSDGTLDPSFTSSIPLYDFAVQSDGKIVIATPEDGIKRLNVDGTPDNSFIDFIEPLSYWHLKIADGDLIYVATPQSVKRLLSTGSPDPSFSPATVDGVIFSLLPVDNGKVVLAGDFTKINDIEANKLGLLKDNGEPDEDFNKNDGPGIGQIYSVTRKADKSLLIGGSIGSYDNTGGTAFELTPDGSYLNTIALTSAVDNVVELSNGKILVTGPFKNINSFERMGIALFDIDRTLYLDFKPDLMRSSGPYYLGTYPTSDGKLIAIGSDFGYIGMYSGTEKINRQIVRLKPTGEYDETYQAPAMMLGSIFSAGVQKGNKLILAGNFIIDGIPYSLCRLESDGSLDPSLSLSSTNWGVITSIKVRDSVIYIASSQTAPLTGKLLAAIDLKGQLKVTYQAVEGELGVRKMAPSPDGKLMVYLDVNRPGEPGSLLVRYNADGTLDNTFGEVPISGTITDIQVSPDGKIYGSGFIGSVHGAILGKETIIRLNANGSIDTNFNAGSGFGTLGVLSISLLKDGNLLAAGNFKKFGSMPVNGVVEVNSSGGFVRTYPFFERNSTFTHLVYDSGNVYATGRILLNDYEKVISIAKITILGPPLAATELKASLSLAGLLRLTWKDNSSDESGFEILRSISQNSGYANVTTLASGTTEYEEAMPSFKTFYYRVRAVNEKGYSAYSNTVSVNWSPLPPTPEELVALGNEEAITLTWKDVSDFETGFVIERTSLDLNLQFETIDTVGINETSFKDKIASWNMTYFYRVAAINPVGKSGYSNVAQSGLILGLEESAPDKVYPNPTKGVVYILPHQGPANSVKLISTSGVTHNLMLQTGPELEQMVDITYVSNGLYLLAIQYKQGVKTYKILKN